MPQIFKFGSYWVYFWANENSPREPVHIHLSEGRPIANGTKVWITKNGKCSLANNNSKIPEKVLNKLLRLIEPRSFEIITKWKEMFGAVSYYC